ncbi:MAG: M23 family metallopeptidase [Phycisphaerae bacterium]|jgi:hypothetical protein|nr:M23 family metallopeptidase [Phycisphaerae bacterium]
MALSFKYVVLTLVIGVTITLAAVRQDAADSTGSEPCPSALTTTFRQRVRSSPFNRPIRTESLILPQAGAKTLKPFLARRGRLRFQNPDLARIVWRIIPKSDMHKQYLQKRSELSDKNWGKLVAWCKDRGLDTLVEYELRCRLARRRDFGNAEYKSALAQWLARAEKHQFEYSFALPVKGVWHVLVDRSKHHRNNAYCAFAFDLIVRKNGRRHQGDPRLNSSYFTWDQPVYAQADGIVETAIDTFDDMPPGKSGPFAKANTIVIDYGAGILASYAHLKKGSAVVKAGNRVTAGQEIARVGNSGDSGTSHLHYTMVDASGFSVRGRYQFEQSIRGGKWLRIDGADLTEGSEIRPVSQPDGATSRPAPRTRPRPTTRSPEQLAASKLRMARAYLSYPKEALARALLQTIVKDYPDTPAAAEARKELAKLK